MAIVFDLCDEAPMLTYLMEESSELIKETCSIPAVVILADAHSLLRVALHTWCFFQVIPEQILQDLEAARCKMLLEHRSDFLDSKALYLFLNDLNRFLHCVSVRIADNF